MAILYQYHFRSGRDDVYYKAEYLSNDYWKYANWAAGYGGLGIWGVALLSQLTTLVGIVPENLNIFVWRALAGSLNALLQATVLGLFIYSYEQSYKALDNTN